MSDQAIFLRTNQHLCRKRNLSRTSGAKCLRNLEAAAIFKHRHNVIHKNAVDEPKSGRRDIHGSLRIVQRIRFIGAPGSQLSRELRGVLSMDKLMENPRPIVFGIRVRQPDIALRGVDPRIHVFFSGARRRGWPGRAWPSSSKTKFGGGFLSFVAARFSPDSQHNGAKPEAQALGGCLLFKLEAY